MGIGEKRALKVFLCHASGDKPQVRTLYKHLVVEGVDAWLDQEKLLPGHDWRIEIPRAVQEADVVVVCLSNKSITKEGYIQKEIKFALDAAEEKPDGTIFLIPARLEDCSVPEKLSRWQWVDLFEDNGYVKLLSSLKLRADKVGAAINPSSYQDGDAEIERRLDQYYTEGLAAFYTEDWSKACQRFQLILSERPGDKNAIEKFEQAERQRDLSKLYVQSMDACQAEDWQAAIKTLDELLKKSPNYKDSAELFKNAKKQKQLKELYAEAKKLHTAKKWHAVLRVFDQIFAVEPNHPDPDELMPSAQKEAAELKRLSDLNDLYSQAVRAMDLGKWYEARELLEQVHKAQIGFLETENLLRKVEDETLKIEKANEQNNQINTLYEQAHGLLRSKNWRNALDKIEEIQKLDSQFEDRDGVAEKAKVALEREDEKAQEQNRLAAMYADAVRSLKEGKYQESLDKWNEVKAIDSKYPDRQQVQKAVHRKLAEAGRNKPVFYKNRLFLIGALGTLLITVIYLLILFGGGNPSTPLATAENKVTPSPVSLTSIASEPVLYDSFNNTIYNGTVDTSLWLPVVKSPNSIEQQNGVLSLSIEPNSGEISSLFATKQIEANQYNFVESKMRLSINKTGQDGDIGLAMKITDKNEQDLIFLCVISRYPPIQTWCEAYGRTDGAEYTSIKKTTDYDVWHTFRIEVDPEINTVFYIDGQKVGSYRPKDAAELIDKDFTVRLEIWTPLQDGIEAQFDDLSIGQYK